MNSQFAPKTESRIHTDAGIVAYIEANELVGRDRPTWGTVADCIDDIVRTFGITPSRAARLVAEAAPITGEDLWGEL
jgi:hypothetical protein